VFYSTENIPYREGLVDSFGFVLWAESVQPAAGRFSINIEPPKGYSTPDNFKLRHISRHIGQFSCI
jgi:hypothetical protein